MKLTDERRELAEKNICLVPFVLSRMNMPRSCDYYEDLYSAGCIGLCTAAALWDSGRSPFSTYAFHTIKHEILREIKKMAAPRCRTVKEYPQEALESPGGFDKADSRVLVHGFIKSLLITKDLVDSKVFLWLAEGKSAKQISGILGMSISSVYKSKKRLIAAYKAWTGK